MDNFYQKYLKYKSKYIDLKSKGGASLTTEDQNIPTTVGVPVTGKSDLPEAIPADNLENLAESIIPKRDGLIKFAKLKRDKFIKYKEFLVSIHKEPEFEGYGKVFTRRRLEAREGTDHSPPVTNSSFGNDPNIYTDKYLQIFYLIAKKNDEFNRENFMENKEFIENFEKLKGEYQLRKERLKKINDYLKNFKDPVGESAGESKE